MEMIFELILAVVALSFSGYFYSRISPIFQTPISLELYMFLFGGLVPVIGAIGLIIFGHYTFKLIEPETAYLSFYLICYVVVSLSFFYFVFNKVLIKGSFQYTSIFKKVSDNDTYILFQLFTIIVCTLSMLYSYSKIDTIPLSMLLNGEMEALKEARFNSKFGFKGSTYVKNIFFFLLANYLMVLFYIKKSIKTSKYRIVHSLFFYWSFALAALASLYTGAKFPIILLFIQLFVAKTFVEQKNEPLLKYRNRYLFIFLLVLSLFAYITPADAYTVLQKLFSRVFLTSIAGHAVALEYFPGHYDFLYTIPLPRFVLENLGLEYQRYSEILMSLHLGNRQSNGVMNTLFSADAYMNYGYVGLFLSPIIVAFFSILVKKAMYTMNTHYRSSESLAGYIMLITSFPILGGFLSYIINFKLMALLFFTAIFSILHHVILRPKYNASNGNS